jgi:hypothetical protein
VERIALCGEEHLPNAGLNSFLSPFWNLSLFRDRVAKGLVVVGPSVGRSDLMTFMKGKGYSAQVIQFGHFALKIIVI